MYGIVIFVLVVLIKNNGFIWMLGFVGWVVLLVWGFLIVKEYFMIFNVFNFFFVSCEIVFNFLLWLFLYEWIFVIFVVKGDCLEDSW